MESKVAPQANGTHKGLKVLPIVGPILGVLTAAFLVAFAMGWGSDAADPSFIVTVMPAYVPAIVLAILIGKLSRDQPRRLALVAMPPVAFGLVVITVLIRLPFPEAKALMTAGAVLSAAPFFAAGVLAKHRR